ncbi:protein NEDD1 isoform X1 [Hypomesus transpacificus]|uniref:protein NEDD1 isoform X1 n=1 Tax=Hypomesus transpacificus TaxID=137520 RepID=UPI001F074E6F|nr:protein NEDD1 isoform X1 [Hypomesus transpacificus]XP_046890272.1 protein NEDD1 isoform X1 [Hypomesus transpacificus]XP_046890273.1 protein NEDD1 isoform X1 [Hypomesus transpacificus]XP_046890274.1 protein NEDD1 isoform X1 [Hypomesus transpacificus]
MEEVTRLVSSGDCVKIWDSASMTVLEQFNPHSATHPVAQVCWSSNNQYLVSASSLGDKLVVSSLKSSAVPVLELGEGKKQTRVSLNSSSLYLVSGGLDNSVNIWDLKSKRLHRNLMDHKEEVTSVTFNGSDSYVASGSTSGDIILHSVTTNLSSKPFGHGTNQPIHDLKYSVVKRSLLGSVSDSGTVVLWDSNTQKELHVFDGAHKAPASGLAFSPTNDLLFVTVGLDKKIICYDTSSKIVLSSIRIESPLTAIDFTPDGTGLVVGSTQGRIYQYDLRNLSAPTKTAAAHKTSVTCLRFQSSYSRHLKSSKVVSSKTSSSKRISAKLGSLHGSAPPTTTGVTTPTSAAALSGFPPNNGDRGEGQVQGTGSSVEVLSREAEGHQSGDRLPSMDKFSSVGRNSLDIFSPVRDDYKALGRGDAPGGIKGNGTSVDVFLRAGEGQHSTDTYQKTGRNSMDIFSPVRDDYKTQGMRTDSLSAKKDFELDSQSSYSGGPPLRKTPLGTTGSRCYSPLTVFQTPPPIKEEEAPPQALTQRCDKNSGSSLEGECVAPPTSAAAQTSYSQKLPPCFTPEPSLMRGSDLQAQLRYDTPVNGTSTTKAPDSAAVASSLSTRITDTIAAEGGGAPLTSLQINFIRNMIHETLEDFRDTCHRDIVNLQVEMVRQFYIQLNEIHGLIEKYSVNDSLVEEIEKLKEENKRLRANY